MKKYNIEISEDEREVIRIEHNLNFDKIQEAMRVLDSLHQRMEKVQAVMEKASLSPRGYVIFVDTRRKIMETIIGSRYNCFIEGGTFIIQPKESWYINGDTVDNEEVKSLKTKLEKEGWKPSKTTSCKTGLRFRISILDEIFDSHRIKVAVAAIRFDV